MPSVVFYLGPNLYLTAVASSILVRWSGYNGVDDWGEIADDGYYYVVVVGVVLGQ